jgi:hypothetical protein
MTLFQLLTVSRLFKGMRGHSFRLADLPFLALGLILIAFLTTLSFSPSVYIDEYWIVSLAASSGDGVVLENHALRNFDKELLNVQPLYFSLVGWSANQLGYRPFSIRLLSAVSIMLCVFFALRLLGQSKEEKPVIVLIGCILLTFPIIWRSGHIERPEPLTLCLVFLALSFNLRFSTRKIINIVKGILIALPLYAYVTGILVFPLVFLVLILGFNTFEDKREFWTMVAYRGIGCIAALVSFFLIIGHPAEVLHHFSGTNISRVNVTDDGLLARLLSYLRFYADYVIENAHLYVPAYLIIAFYFVKNRLRDTYSILLALLYLVSLFFLMILSRRSVNYLIYSEVFFFLLFLWVTLRLAPRIRNVIFGYLLVTNVLCVTIYTMYFVDYNFDLMERKLRDLVNSEKPVVLARIPYKGYFFDNDNFLAFEDFENLVKVNETLETREYFLRNGIEWVILDDETLKEPRVRPLVDFAIREFQKVATINDAYVGHRIYDDIPFRWDIRDIWAKLANRPMSTIEIYKAVPANSERSGVH